MSARISRAEWALLQYLHEHGGAPGGRIGLDPKPLMRELRIGTARFAADAASLAARGLVGVRNVRPGADGAPSAKCAAIWVTSKGEDHLVRRFPPGLKTPGEPTSKRRAAP